MFFVCFWRHCNAPHSSSILQAGLVSTAAIAASRLLLLMLLALLLLLLLVAGPNGGGPTGSHLHESLKVRRLTNRRD